MCQLRVRWGNEEPRLTLHPLPRNDASSSSWRSTLEIHFQYQHSSHSFRPRIQHRMTLDSYDVGATVSFTGSPLRPPSEFEEHFRFEELPPELRHRVFILMPHTGFGVSENIVSWSSSKTRFSSLTKLEAAVATSLETSPSNTISRLYGYTC